MQDFIKIKTTIASYCRVCGRDFKHLDVVYFAPIDNNILCPKCSEIHKDRQLRIYVKEN